MFTIVYTESDSDSISVSGDVTRIGLPCFARLTFRTFIANWRGIWRRGESRPRAKFQRGDVVWRRAHVGGRASIVREAIRRARANGSTRADFARSQTRRLSRGERPTRLSLSRSRVRKRALGISRDSGVYDFVVDRVLPFKPADAYASSPFHAEMRRRRRRQCRAPIQLICTILERHGGLVFKP